MGPLRRRLILQLQLSNNNHTNPHLAVQGHSGVSRLSQSGRDVSQSHPQIVCPTNTFVDDCPQIIAEPSQYMSRDSETLDQPPNVTASQQRGQELNLHYDKHFHTPTTNRHQVEANINHPDHCGSSNVAGTHGHVHRPDASLDDEFVAKGSFQGLIFEDDSSMTDFDGTEQTPKRTPDKRRAMDNESENIFNFTPRAEGHPNPVSSFQVIYPVRYS